jgi:hypothetical protein
MQHLLSTMFCRSVNDGSTTPDEGVGDDDRGRSLRPRSSFASTDRGIVQVAESRLHDRYGVSLREVEQLLSCDPQGLPL